MPRPLQNLAAVAAATAAAFLTLVAVTAGSHLVLPFLAFVNMVQLGILIAGTPMVPGYVAVMLALLLLSFMIGGVTLLVGRRAAPGAPPPFARRGRATGAGFGLLVSLPFVLHLGNGEAGLVLFAIGTGFWVLACAAAGQVAGIALRAVLRRLETEWRG